MVDAYLDVLRQTAMQLPGLVILKGTDSRIMAMNDALASLLGLPTRHAAEGFFEWEIAPHLGEAAATFRQQDASTWSHRRGRFLDLLTYADGHLHLILSEKVCLVDAQGQPRALLFQGTDLTQRLMGHVGRILIHSMAGGISYALDAPPVAERRLTPRQAECLFLLLRGQTARHIAARLYLSPRTVEDYLDQLKDIFHCRSRAELIETAFNEGFGPYLPPSLLA